MESPDLKAIDFKLCFVVDDTLIFSTRQPHLMRGHKWNVPPFEHNAGTPYPWTGDDAGPRYWLTTVRFDREGWYLPNDGHLNSPFSAHLINRGKEPWLKNFSQHDFPPAERVEIYAGTGLPFVVEAILKAGGNVWKPVALGELPPLRFV